MKRVVSRGDLRAILQAHIVDPSPRGLRYYELPVRLSREEWETLDDVHRGWYDRVADRADGSIIRHPVATLPDMLVEYELQPGSYDAWVIETP